jgi:hypothetical protein
VKYVVEQLDIPVVVLTTSKTSTTRMFPVLAYTTMTSGYMAPVLAGVGETGRHFKERTI